MSTISFRTSEHFDALIDRLIESGRYTGKTEVMNAALRLLEDFEASREERLAALVEAVEEGDRQIAAGQWSEYSVSGLSEKIKREGRERLRKKQQSDS